MLYEVEFAPHYGLECIAIICNVVNETSIADECERIIKSRGDNQREEIEELFAAPIAMEAYFRKHIDFSLPPYEATGKEMAKFLFSQNATADKHFAYAIMHHMLSAERGVNSYETAIIDHLCSSLVEEIYETDTLPLCTPSDFFTLVEKTDATSEDKLAAMHLYHNFETYSQYLTDLLAHSTELYVTATPTAATLATSLMSTIEENLDKNGNEYIRQLLGITPVDGEIHLMHPSLYSINSFSAFSIHGTKTNLCVFGLHFLQLVQVVKEASDPTMLIEFTKCIADDTKRNILLLLKKEPMYGRQLAGVLNRTTANISQQLSKLLSIGVITLEVENNRMYAHLQREKIHEYMDGLRNVF